VGGGGGVHVAGVTTMSLSHSLHLETRLGSVCRGAGHPGSPVHAALHAARGVIRSRGFTLAAAWAAHHRPETDRDAAAAWRAASAAAQNILCSRLEHLKDERARGLPPRVRLVLAARQ
jgi:hypothetical protein